MNLQQPCFNCLNLTIGLYGSENIYFHKRHRQGKRTYWKDHFGNFPIIEMVFPVADFYDEAPAPGQWSYPFTLQLPEWIPASMMLGGDEEQAQLSIQYSLRAQFTPTDMRNMDGVVPGLSSFRGARMIYVYRPVLQTPSVDLSYTLNSEVGGFLGMGTSECKTQIFFDKNQYYLGETAQVRLIVDNTKCEKDIKSLKFKLLRSYQGKE